MSTSDTSRTHRILRPGHTVWRIAEADRFALLLDGAEYFGALRSALLQARRSVTFVGWDIDSRVRLRGADAETDNDAPEGFRDFLEYLVGRRRELTIRLLLWDYSVLYALEREPLPSLNLDWRTPSRVIVALDDALPNGASHHQKIVVIDDTLAFCGGLDIAVNRWDTADHRPGDPDRMSPSGERYGPFHDAQAVLDGDSARCLAELVRDRWRRATEETLAAAKDPEPIWPDGVKPDFEAASVGIARTLPQDDDQPAVTEILDLYREAIRHARRYIYIENQYLTTMVLADALADALEREPDLELLVVSPERPQGWLETKTMGVGQARFMERLDTDSARDRVRFCYPYVADGEDRVPVMVHAKLLVADDRLVRIGSANLNNRSMGLDTECDVAIEADDEPGRKAVRRLLCRLLGHHLGEPPERVEDEMDSRESLLAVVDALGSPRRGLTRLEPATEEDDVLADALNVVADRETPLAPESFVGDMFDPVSVSSGLKRATRLILAALAAAGLVLAWNYTPLAAWTDPERIAAWIESFRASGWSIPILLAAYVIGGMLLFPLTVLVTVTGMVLGPWTGLLCALTGSLSSGAAGFAVGHLAGRRTVRHLLGKRYRVIRRAMSRNELIAVTAVRMVPVAPYTVVNIVLGAIGTGFRPYITGTFLGLLPGVAALTVLGDRLLQAWRNPDPMNTVWLVLAMLAWLALALGLQRLAARVKKD